MRAGLAETKEIERRRTGGGGGICISSYEVWDNACLGDETHPRERYPRARPMPRLYGGEDAAHVLAGEGGDGQVAIAREVAPFRLGGPERGVGSIEQSFERRRSKPDNGVGGIGRPVRTKSSAKLVVQALRRRHPEERDECARDVA